MNKMSETQQNKNHPFDIALKALSPVFAPSFFLRSPRDRENNVKKYPLIDYIIISGGTKTYNSSLNQWRSSFDIQLDILIQETAPLSWCQFDELKDAQDRHALQHHFDEMILTFLTLLLNPSAIDRVMNNCDMIYSKFEFQLETFIGSNYWQQYGKDKLTGISSRFTLSALSEFGSGCCLIDNSVEQWQRLQDLTIPDSTSFKLIDKKINP